MPNSNFDRDVTLAAGTSIKTSAGTTVVSVSSAGVPSVAADVSTVNLTTTGNTTLGNAVSDTLAVNGATTITTTSASGLTIGRQGATAPVLKVNAATASVATGIEITGAAAAGGVAVAAISSGTNENLTIDAKGSGTITLGGTSTGPVSVQRATTVNNTLTVNGVGSFAAGEAVAAGGNTNSRILLSSTAGLGIYFGSGAPTVSAAQGSLYICTDGSSTSTRMYINTNGSTTWTNVTTAA